MRLWRFPCTRLSLYHHVNNVAEPQPGGCFRCIPAKVPLRSHAPLHNVPTADTKRELETLFSMVWTARWTDNIQNIDEMQPRACCHHRTGGDKDEASWAGGERRGGRSSPGTDRIPALLTDSFQHLGVFFKALIFLTSVIFLQGVG